MGMSDTDMLGQAVVELLDRIPETWQEYVPDDLTDIQSNALGLLIKAGMVEGWNRVCLRMHTHSVMAEATITFTGEHGFVEAIEPLIASLWADWEESFRKWKDSEAGDSPSGHCELLEPSKWRLTDQGVQARKDIKGDQRDSAVDFVLKRGFLTVSLVYYPMVGSLGVKQFVDTANWLRWKKRRSTLQRFRMKQGR